MPIVKSLRYGQITLPKKFRESLNIKEGDLLEAELWEDRIVLTPRALLNKDRAWERVFQVLEKVHEKTKHISAEEAEHDALELIEATRRREYARNTS